MELHVTFLIYPFLDPLPPRSVPVLLSPFVVVPGYTWDTQDECKGRRLGPDKVSRQGFGGGCVVEVRRMFGRHGNSEEGYDTCP